MDNLLESVGRLVREGATLALPRRQSRPAYTPGQIAVRDAYLEEWTGRTPEERERAFDVAMCLSPILRAYQHVTFFESLALESIDRPEGVLEKHSTVAGYLEEAMRRWTVMLRPTVV